MRRGGAGHLHLHPQVGLYGDRRPLDDRVEEGSEGLEKAIVVEQLVDVRQVAGQPLAALRQEGLPQRQLEVYQFAARWLQSLAQRGIGAIVTTFPADREHRGDAKAQVTGFFLTSLVRTK